MGFLLLCTLGYAVGHPAQSSASVLRLLWCVLPLAATVQFAVAVARTDPSTRPRPGLSAIGLGPVRLTAVAAASTAVACTLGSMVALLFYLHLRGDITGLPFDGAAAELLAADQPLPLAAALTLLAILPVVAATAAGLALRPRSAPADPEGVEKPVPSGLPWGVALVAVGLAIETYAGRGGSGDGLPLPGSFDGNPAGVLAGWVLTAFGLALAGPGLTYGCGRLLQSVRPGATRLLAGRVLMDESRRIGRPLGVVSAVLSGTLAAAALYASGTGPAAFGPLTGLGAALVMACTTATLLTAALESKQCRTHTTEALLRLGAPPTVLRTAALMRTGALVAVFLPLTWIVAELAALPLTG
ncbi:Putative integral membrane protein [Streptomyces venezuelae]|nr:Putative integral membrane protein [Streptomyces venezuelae]